MNIIEQIYYIGDSTTLNGLECNPYLLIDHDEAVLFDPGSKLDFEVVLQNIKELIDIHKIKYIVLHHQDPDFCSAVPLLETLGIRPRIVTSWRAMTLIQYYGIQSDYYLLEEHGHELVLASGRVLRFIPTPYLHFAGAFTTYDTKTKALFSSDLFGAFSFNQTMFADEDYLEKMLTFHEHYMPSNSVIRPVMDVLSGYQIDMILPQHGSIIKKDVGTYIEALRTLECGTLLTPIKKDLMASGGYLKIFNDTLKRLLALYTKEEVLTIFQSIPVITVGEDDKITGYTGNPADVWNVVFDAIKDQAGMIWITSIEPYIRKLVATYEIQMPTVFESLIKSADLENQRLMKMNQSLEQTIHQVNERLTKNSITGLYNEVFLKSLLMEELDKEDWRDMGAFASIKIDDFSNYKVAFGLEEVNSALNNLAYLLKEQFGNHAVFQLDSADFGIYLKGFERNVLIEKMEAVRIQISKSELFLNKITVSIGIAFPDEIQLDLSSYDMTASQYMELSFSRLRRAKHTGKNHVYTGGGEEQEQVYKNSVLIVDSDRTNVEVLETFIKNLGIEVFIAEDGIKALEIVEEKAPNIIVTEINIPKLDGFLIKEKLLSNSKTKNIEVIFLSYQKDEDSVNRAQELGVTHYVKKPYLLSELIGLIKRNIRGVNE